MANVENDAAKERTRSPGFPTIPLADAIAKVEVLWEQEHAASVTLEVLAEHLKSSVKSSAFLQWVASLKRFGLVEEGSGGARQVRISALGKEIVVLPDDNPRRASAIKEAALMPKAYLELWQEYGVNLPSDRNIQAKLVMEKGYKPDAAADMVRQYRRTLEFAKLSEADKMTETRTVADAARARKDFLSDPFSQFFGQPPAPKQQQGGAAMTGATQQINPPPVLPTPAGLKDFPAQLSAQRRAFLYVPGEMTQREYDLLKQQITGHLSVIEATLIRDEKDQEN